MPYVYPSWTPNPWMANPWMANPWMVNPYMMNPWMPYSNLYSPFGPLSGFNSMNYWGMPFAGGMGGAGLPASGFGSGFGTY
jgi:hypothetical protein